MFAVWDKRKNESVRSERFATNYAEIVFSFFKMPTFSTYVTLLVLCYNIGNNQNEHCWFHIQTLLKTVGTVGKGKKNWT